MLPFAFVPLLFGGLSVASTVASISATNKAAKQQKKIYEAEQRKADIENVYKARQAIRQASIAQGTMINQAALSGGLGGTGLFGGLSSVAAQTGSNLNTMASIAEENTTIVNSSISSANAQSKAAVWGSIGKLAGTIFSDQASWYGALNPPKGS